MNDAKAVGSPLVDRQIVVEGISIHIVDGGPPDASAAVFVHGWPESSATFEKVMIALSGERRVVALDLPGIGDSESPAPSNDKRTLAKYVHGVIASLDLKSVTLVGHDIGAMIVFAYLHAYPGELERAVLMNIAIPGVDPWDEVKRNPYIWHFAFHAIPELPETLVSGKQDVYFGWFYDQIAAKKTAVSEQTRKTYVRAYSRLAALRTGFDWYRAFPQDEKDNATAKDRTVATPVLYLRGEIDRGSDLDRYVTGLRQAGLINVHGDTIKQSGHFAPDEQPDAVVAALWSFMGLGRR